MQEADKKADSVSVSVEKYTNGQIKVCIHKRLVDATIDYSQELLFEGKPSVTVHNSFKPLKEDKTLTFKIGIISHYSLFSVFSGMVEVLGKVIGIEKHRLW